MPSRFTRRRVGHSSPLAQARQYRDELEKKLHPHQLALARAHAVSAAKVSRLLAVLDMPAALQQLVDRGLRLQTAARIHALPPAEYRRVVRGLEQGRTLRSLFGESTPRRPPQLRRPTQQVKEAFAQRFREARLRRRVTQQQLAQDLGVSQSTVGTWETGRTVPATIALVRLADMLEVSIDWLLSREARNQPRCGHSRRSQGR